MLKNKKLILTLIAAVILFVNYTQAAIIDSGNCAGSVSYVDGKHVYSSNACTYTIDDKGVLTISGVLDKGWLAYNSYGRKNGNLTAAPWGDYKDVVTKVNIEEGIKLIPESAFSGMNRISEVFVADSVTGIGNGAFAYSGVTSVNFGENSQLVSIGDSAFFNATNLENINLPEGLQSIGYLAFSEATGLTTLTIPDSVESISYDAFWNTSIKELELPSGIVLDPFALEGMANLQKLTFSDDTEINLVQFLDDSNLDIYNTSDILYAIEAGDLNNLIEDFQNTGGFHINLPTIYCKGDPEDCKANLYWPEELEEYLNPLNDIQVKEAIVATSNPDGSQTLKTWRGELVGYKNKRIYTIDEANQVAKPTGNRVSITYR